MAGSDRYDIFDVVGESSFVSCRPLLAPGGSYVTTLPTPSLFSGAAFNRLPEFSGTRNAQREY
jgi:hypothetical protein